MYTPNSSLESLKSSKSPKLGKSFYKSSQSNPNSSLTNLNNVGGRTNLFEPSPRRFDSRRQNHDSSDNGSQYQFPMSPPISNSTTPTKERDQPLFTFFGNDSDLSLINRDAVTPIKSYHSQDNTHNVKIGLLCFSWYLASVVSNYSTKLILLNFLYPVTLTQFQFIINSGLCLLLFQFLLTNPKFISQFPKGVLPNFHDVFSIKKFVIPTSFILSTTLPMGIFQFIGHLTSHQATSLIPVSLNHTVKALSPILTVLMNRFLFKRQYPLVSYLTLIPLVSGIMLSCYKNKNTNTQSINNHYYQGIFFSCVSMIIFVSQNIFAKTRLTSKHNDKGSLPLSSSKQEKKLDKLSILFHCSIFGFGMTLPVYLLLEFKSNSFSLFDLNSYVLMLIVINGVSHFLQSLLAFQILSQMSPVNYSIANISKRVIIIIVAFLIEGKKLMLNQVIGIGLTIIGLFAYDKWGSQKQS